MKTIVLASRKGGAGKSTLSIHLAVQASQGGKNKVMLLDLDPQGSSAYWASIREADYPEVKVIEPAKLGVELGNLKRAKYDFVIVDTPPNDNDWVKQCFEKADAVLIPTKASAFDVHSAVNTLEWAKQAGPKISWVINGASVFSRAADDAAQELKKLARVCKTVVHERNAFLVAVGAGLAVTESEPSSKAALEIEALWKEVKTWASR